MKKKETHSFTRRHQIFYKKKRKTDIKKEKEGGKKKKQNRSDWIGYKTRLRRLLSSLRLRSFIAMLSTWGLIYIMAFQMVNFKQKIPPQFTNCNENAVPRRAEEELGAGAALKTKKKNIYLPHIICWRCWTLSDSSFGACLLTIMCCAASTRIME